MTMSVYCSTHSRISSGRCTYGKYPAWSWVLARTRTRMLLGIIVLFVLPVCDGLRCAVCTNETPEHCATKHGQLCEENRPECFFEAVAVPTPTAEVLRRNQTQRGDGASYWKLTAGCYDREAAAASRSNTLRFTVCKNVSNKHHQQGCCTTDLCNAPWNLTHRLTVQKTALPSTSSPSSFTIVNDLVSDDNAHGADHSTIYTAVGVLAGIVVFGGLALVLLLVYRARRKRTSLLSKYKTELCHRLPEKPGLYASHAQPDSGYSEGDSSGRGVFQLEQRTVSREIALVSRIGTGRYGEVYRGVWRGSNVAVKIFKTMDEDSFFREVELFNTNMLRHENIVGFLAADNRDCSMETQLWMVLDYHSNGSLFDYLRHHTASSTQAHTSLSLADVLRLASSTVAGLSHLHLHIGGSNGFQSFGHKPSIAHRDLKSKNILVKASGACCIADLGMAIRDDVDTGDLQYVASTNLKAGTRRYMAPEILDGAINPGMFEPFRQADMYSLAIVLWEIVSCCHLPNTKEPHYQLPYENLIPGDPSVEDMHKVVCVAGCRPGLPGHWQEHKVFEEISRILRACWRATPSGRLPAQNVAKKLLALLDDVTAPREKQAPAVSVAVPVKVELC